MNVERIMVGVRQHVDRVTRAVATEALAGVVQASPVDTGRLRGNWTVGLGNVNRATSERTDPSGAATIQGGIAVIGQAQPGQSITIANSLPYAAVIENGSSKQAPQGVAAITAERLRANLRRLAERTP